MLYTVLEEWEEVEIKAAQEELIPVEEGLVIVLAVPVLS
jgi:hypothetical protein